MRVPLAVRALPAVAERAWFTPPRFQVNGGTGAASIPGRSMELTAAGSVLQGYAIGEGPVVVLAHGWGGTAGSMGLLAVSIADSGFTAVAFDAPGHGSHPQTTSDVFQMATTLRAVADDFGEPAAVVAHSLGALAALLAFEDPPPMRAVFLAPGLDVNQMLATFATRARLLPWTTRALRRRIQRFTADRWPTMTSGSDLDWGETSLLLVHDPADRQISFDASAALAAKRPRTELVVARGLGHGGVLKDPATIDHVARFLAAP